MKPKKRKPSLTFADKYSKYLIAGSLAFVLLFAVAIRLRLVSVPLERDEGEYAYAGQLMLHGFPPYLYAYNMKFPGVYGAYALIMAVFGQTPAGIRAGLLLVNAATTILLFVLAKRLIDAYTGIAAAATFAVLTLGQPVMGTFAHATHFVILFAVSGLLMLSIGLDGGRKRDLFVSGLLFGLALLMKQHAVFILFFAFVYLCWKGYRSGTGFREQALKITAFSAGVLVPIGGTGLLLLKAGVFGKFWFWTFTYASSYVTQTPFGAGLQSFLSKFGRIVSASPLVWLLAAAGIVSLRWTEKLKGERAFVIGFTVSSFLAMVPGLYFREHYFILILPAAALLTAVAVSWLRQVLLENRWLGAYRAGPMILLTFAMLWSIVAQREFLFEMSPLEASRSTYGRNPFPESIDAANYLRANSGPSDRIAVIGSEPQIYFYANRLSATGYIYMYGLMEPQAHALDMQQEMIREVETAQPEFVVYVPGNESWLKQPGSANQIFDWAGAYIKGGFDLVGMAEMTASGPAKWYWNEETSRYPPRAPPSILVYRRKNAAAGKSEVNDTRRAGA